MIDWRQRAGTTFAPERAPVTAEGGRAVTNQPLASATAVLAGGMAAVLFERAPMRNGGGQARKEASFWPDPRRARS